MAFCIPLNCGILAFLAIMKAQIFGAQNVFPNCIFYLTLAGLGGVDATPPKVFV